MLLFGSETAAAFLLMMSIIVTPVSAADPVSVKQLVDQAIERHPELLAMESELEAARAAKAQAGTWSHPELAGDIGQKTVRDSGDDGLVYSVELAQTFEYPGKIATRKAIAGKHIELAEMGLEVFRRTLEMEIRTLAGEWTAHRALSDTLNDLAATTEAALDGYLKRTPAGAQQTIEQKLVEGAILDMKREVLEANREAAASLAALNQMLGRPDGELLNIDMASVTATRIDTPAISLTHHPLTRLRAMELELARLEAEGTRLNARPDVTAGPYYNEESAGEDEYTVGVVFSVPLPLWNRTSGDAAKAQADQDKAIAAMALSERELLGEWNRRLRDVEHYKALLDQFSEVRLSSMRAAAELAAQQFQAGAISAPLFLDMQREYISSVVTRHEALSGFNREISAMNAFTMGGEK